MLASFPSLQALPVRPSGKEKHASDSGSNEEFSEHLGSLATKSFVVEKPELVATVELGVQLSNLDSNLDDEVDIATDGEINIEPDIELLPLASPPDTLPTPKIFEELHFSQGGSDQKVEVAQSVNLVDATQSFNLEEVIPSGDEATVLLSGDGVLPEQSGEAVKVVLPGDDRMMAPPSQTTEVLEDSSPKIPTINQNSSGMEKNILSVVSQPVLESRNLVREPKTNGEKFAKPKLMPAVNIQTQSAGKSSGPVQNPLPQQDLAVQPNITLPQEREAVVDADLEKTVQSLELKTPTTSVSVDPSTQKTSVDVSVTNLSQPSQTLIRAIQENSNWTKVLTSSTVQVEQTPKIDGTVLQKLDIHLNLSALGKIDVKLRLHQGELQIQIRTDSEQAFKMLSADQDVLANTIKGLGYKVDNIAISGPRTDGGFQMNSNSQTQEQQPTEHQFKNERGGQRADREFAPIKDADNDTQTATQVIEHNAPSGAVI